MRDSPPSSRRRFAELVPQASEEREHRLRPEVGVGPRERVKATLPVLQRRLGEDPAGEIDAVTAILGRGEDDLRLGEVARVEVDGTNGEDVSRGEIALDLEGDPLRLRERARIHEITEGDQALHEGLPHRPRVIARVVERVRLARQKDRPVPAPELGDGLGQDLAPRREGRYKKRGLPGDQTVFPACWLTVDGDSSTAKYDSIPCTP